MEDAPEPAMDLQAGDAVDPEPVEAPQYVAGTGRRRRSRSEVSNE